MASSSKEQELAIKIAGKVENSFKQSLGVTEDGLNKIASVAKKPQQWRPQHSQPLRSEIHIRCG